MNTQFYYVPKVEKVSLGHVVIYISPSIVDQFYLFMRLKWVKNGKSWKD
jgi:hypothetical protein